MVDDCGFEGDAGDQCFLMVVGFGLVELVGSMNGVSRVLGIIGIG